MAWEDCFLRLDPYNFDTEEEYMRFHHPEYFEDEEKEVSDERCDFNSRRSSNFSTRTQENY